MFGGPAAGRWRLVRTNANGSPAFAIYQKMEAGHYQAFGIHVVERAGNEISQVTSFIDPALPARFGLPAILS
jgi:RNA polymerase sigma-70 factor (ECF subfamily)